MDRREIGKDRLPVTQDDPVITEERKLAARIQEPGGLVPPLFENL
jgi:hypothetical protein